jgi:isoleucyl-tRNA synthetase
MDCWFDSGSMPFSQWHYPFENKNLIDKKEQFPAEYISEAIDQTRGWFYTLLAISTLLGFKTPYKNVISLGHILDEKGEKMSKSKGNIVDPWYIVEKYGVDSTRWYFFTVNQPGDPKLFSEKDVEAVLKRFTMILWNCFVFFETYKNDFKFEKENPKFGSDNILDKWIVSKLNNLTQGIENNLNNYDINNSARALESFIINDFSQWYIRRSRKRFQKPETEQEKKEAFSTFYFVLYNLSKILAPFLPFISEEIYKKLGTTGESVHLSQWPKIEKKNIDNDLEKKMKLVQELVTVALAERSKAQIKVRQPLKSLTVKAEELKGEEELLSIIKEEINVKEIVFDNKIQTEIVLDTNITPELKKEGEIRENSRGIKELRKTGSLTINDTIAIGSTFSDIVDSLNNNLEEFGAKEIKIKSFIEMEKEGYIIKEVVVDGKIEHIGIKKI